jgi:uncharacterized phage protein (TIGR01671 family)
MEFKVEPKKICFKGFALAANGSEKIKINNKELHGGWVEGDFSQYDTEYYIKNYRIEPKTLGQFTGYILADESKIYENDIVKITLHTGKEIYYLIWFDREGCETIAINIDNIKFDGINFNNSIGCTSYAIGDFHIMLSDFYGMVKKSQVIGNLFDLDSFYNQEKYETD